MSNCENRATDGSILSREEGFQKKIGPKLPGPQAQSTIGKFSSMTPLTYHTWNLDGEPGKW